MSWKYQIGRIWSGSRDALFACPWFPLTTAIPWGTVWPYDVMRLARTRKLTSVFDVGANTGQTVALLHRFFPDAVIHSFEPVPSTYAQLERNTAAIANVRIHPIALGNRPGTIRMTDGVNSEINSAILVDSTIATCEVAAETLDRFCENRAIEHIDILKIDVEGYELAVLEGAENLFKTGSIRNVYVEVGFESDDRLHTIFDRVRSHLTSRGFGFAGLYEPWRYPECRGRIAFANALFWRI